MLNIITTIKKTLIAMAVVTAAVSQAGASDTVIRVGTESSSGPFVFTDRHSKTLTGFDIELIRAIAEAANFKIEFVPMTFDEIIPAIQANSVDAGISCITITEKRKKRVVFSEPYIQGGLGIMIRRNMKFDIQDAADLKGRRVCAQTGTMGASYVKDIDEIEQVLLDTDTESFMALKHGECDAIVNDLHVLAFYLGNVKTDDLIMLKDTISSYEYEYGIAIDRYNGKLQTLIRTGMERVLENGTYKRLYDKYFLSGH